MPVVTPHPAAAFTSAISRIAVGLLFLSLLVCARSADKVGLGKPSGPNFVVILCDDLGWGDLASYGHPHIETPHLDLLARQGVQFTHCYSAAPVCSPARVGLLTGRSPNRAGVFDWIPDASDPASAANGRHLVHLRVQEVTLPGLLKAAGYATAVTGKWHNNARFNHPSQAQPPDAGFDYWFATQNNAAPSHRNPRNFVRNGKPVGELTGYSCQIVADEASAWLDRHRSANPAQPFFLFVSFHEPHEPVASPPELVAKYATRARNADEAEYFANVENMDRAVGAILATLERLDLEEDTVVFFTSDNGPETHNRYAGARRSYGTPGPLRGMKLWTTEAGIRVPGILRWPGKVAAGMISDRPVSSLDLLPTFAALAGVQIPTSLQLDGTNLRPGFAGGEIPRDRPLFWVYYNALNEHRVAIRDGPWKLLAKLEGGELARTSNVTARNADSLRAARLTDYELYRLDDDPGEALELSSQEPARLKALAAQLESTYRDLVATMHVWPDAPPSNDTH